MQEKKRSEITPDSRFESMGKEALMVMVYWLVMFAGIMLSAVFLGGGDSTEYTYLFGFPLWFTVCIGIMLVGIAVGIFMVLKVFKNVSLDAEDPEYNYEKGERK